MIKRKKTRAIQVGSVAIGGDNPVVIQSMTNTKTEDIQATLAQIELLAKAGCKIVRCAIQGENSIEAFRQIKKQTKVPLVADIHFNYKLAIAVIEAGADKVRINPGNIGAPERVKAVVDAAKAAKIPLRIGVNSGSLEEHIRAKYGHPTPEALAESALHNMRLVESFGFDNYIVSIKASDVTTTVDACLLLSEQSDTPQHIGITEAGTVRTGAIRSAVGVGALLYQGVGDTIRVSLSGDPLQEIYAAREILKSLHLASGPVVIACPTCGRTDIDVAALAEKVEALVAGIAEPITIAVMGCVVNGPGEARDADIGIAGGRGEGQIIKNGEVVAKVKEELLLETLWKHIQEIVGNH